MTRTKAQPAQATPMPTLATSGKAGKRTPKAKTPPKPTKRTTAKMETEAEAGHFDLWAASHQTITMLAVTLARYGENEGRWRRKDVQEDLLKAYTAIAACLRRSGLAVRG